MCLLCFPSPHYQSVQASSLLCCWPRSLSLGVHAVSNMKPRRIRYPNYWSQERLMKGLKSGLLFKGELRVNPGDRKQGFVTVEGLPADVLIQVRRL